MYIYSAQLHVRKNANGRNIERLFRYATCHASQDMDNAANHAYDDLTISSDDTEIADLIDHVKEHGMQFTVHFHPSYEANVLGELLIIQPECENMPPKQAILFTQYLLKHTDQFAIDEQYAVFDMTHIDSIGERSKKQPIMVTPTGHIVRTTTEEWAESLYLAQQLST